MRRTRRHLAAILGAGTVMLAAAIVWAQSGEDFVLHEYFSPWDVDIRGAAVPGEGVAAKPDPERRPERVPGDAPGLSVNPGADEVIFGADGPVDPGSTTSPYGPLDPAKQSSRLDNNTDRVDQLNYYSNFEPTVVPYKRVVVQNRVRRSASGEYSFGLVSNSYQAVPVEGGQPSSGEDAFWGSFLVRAEPGVRHPLPSVAASQRILEVQAEPDAKLRFVKDEADNFYVVPDSDGLLRLNIRIAAPASYFGGALPAGVRWSAFDQRRTPDLPTNVSRTAADVLESLSITRQMKPRDALRGLVEHYRDFEGRAFPDDLVGEDLYASLTREQIGVCRHRSLAFLISARALGIPTRYIYNEAHAFVEVHWPKAGWRRIDLGGAANDLNYSGDSGGPVHSAGQDTLPQPPNYQAEMERMSQNGDAPATEGADSEGTGTDGGSDVQRGDENAAQRAADGAADGARHHDDDGARHHDDGARHHDDDGARHHDDDGARHHDDGAQTDQSARSHDDAGEHELAETGAPEATEDDRTRVILEVASDSAEVFRGKALGLQGRMVTATGEPVANRPVEVVLGPIGARTPKSHISLGTLTTDARGRFRGKLAIPEDVAIGRWSVFVRFAGDEDLRPARGE